ncbi:F0F1 ATP synthase subunit A [Streptococcus thoraltensis]|uniref:F0F1 ATP synthase subunit A n=1 Tax=Streptococcus thoraltensis TaxID=55085 RepID=UPI00036E307F|nr:F0F1 ATP synthase subunit A [Streptococcus thoraltensis]MDY4762352.1 F0F1 ATP synthase subunit A [Streptococcus thoraltensis]
MGESTNPTASFLGLDFDLTILAMCLLTVLIIFLSVFWASRSMTLKPKGKQNVLEWTYEFVQDLIRPNVGKYTSNYTLFAFALFLFILIANNIGLVTKLNAGDYNFWTSPTSNIVVDFSLSLIVATIVHVEGVRKNGFKGYLKGYLAPTPAMLPMNILEELTNVASLALRLYGNIFSGEVVLSLLVTFANLSIFTAPIAFLLNLAWTAFSIFISAIQAYVFVLLASTYIGKKVVTTEE